jgi:hypothetical protein
MPIQANDGPKLAQKHWLISYTVKVGKTTSAQQLLTNCYHADLSQHIGEKY